MIANCINKFTINMDEPKKLIQIPDNEKMKMHKCEICDKEYKNKKGLGNHFNNVHKFNLIKEHQCNICQSGFDLQSQLTWHMKIAHENKKQHKCDSCNKCFSIIGSLKTYINSVHNVEKDHHCDTCR